MTKCFRSLIRKERRLIVYHHLAISAGTCFLRLLLSDHVLLHISESVYAVLLAIVRALVYVLYLLLVVLLLIRSGKLGRLCRKNHTGPNLGVVPT